MKMHLVAITLDCNGTLTHCNEYLLDLTGWRADEVLGRNWFEIFIPPEEHGLRSIFEDLLRDSPESWHHGNPILTKFGELRFIRGTTH
jgi:PAS domain S-box-containing protein